jgi:hypothetical protein
MFTDTENQNLYIFDSIAGDKTGALNVLSSGIELNPVERYDASFTYPLDLMWQGAIVTFEGEPIYRSVDDVGLWVMVENPPWITMDGYDYDYVDNNICNIDFSDDKGSHSLFRAQKYGPDSIFDTLAQYMDGERIEDYVDNNLSDVDSSEDKGSHSNFTAQQYGPDSLYDTLTESSGSTNTYSLDATGGHMIVGNGNPDWGSARGTISFWLQWDIVDDRPWGQHTNMETRISGTHLVLDWGGDNSLTSSTSFTAGEWYFIAIVWDEFSNDLILYVGDEDTAPTVDASTGSWYSSVSYVGVTQNNFMNSRAGSYQVNGHGDDLRYYDTDRGLAEIQSDYNIELTGSEANLRSYFKLNNNFDDIGPDNNDGSGSGSYSFSTDVAFGGAETNYELDLEVQFTNLVDFLPTEELCIYAGALGSEDLRVDYWSGSAWENLATDLTADSWNNYTVSLTSSTFTVRFNGGSETSDTTQDQWEIDAVLVRSEGTGSKEHTVGNDTSDVDSSADLGNLVDFDNMKTADLTYADLTESVSGGGITFVNVAEASATSGTSAQVNKPTDTAENDFMMALLVSTTSSGDGSTMSSVPPGWTLEHDYIQSAYSGQHVYIYWKVAGASEPSSYTWTWTSYCGWVAQITTFRGVDTSSPIHVEGAVNQESSSSPMSPSITTTEDNCVIWLYDMCDDDDVPYSGGAPGGTSWIDRTEINSPGNGIGISTAYFVQATAGATGNRDWTLDDNEENSGQQYALKPAPTDYRLVQEVQWTNVPHSLPNEELSIYGGSMGDEDILVDVWNGTSWETVFTDLSSGWNNVSITQWLTTSNFTIRFRDGTEVGDASPDTWLIDVALIHVWNVQVDGYDLDLEVQWTDADFDEDNEELCIYGGAMGAEDIMVDVWNGSSWVNVFTDLNSGWNNVTVSEYLISPIFTIRFKGADIIGDMTQDFWAIDATLLHLWN